MAGARSEWSCDEARERQCDPPPPRMDPHTPHEYNCLHPTKEHKPKIKDLSSSSVGYVDDCKSELAPCSQCADCTQVTAEQSRKLSKCTHGTECVSPAAHYHNCRKLCGYSRRVSEARRKAGPGKSASIKRTDKTPRHYKCKLLASECTDMECHHHVGRAPVYRDTCSMQDVKDALLQVTGKDAAEAVSLWEQLDDGPVATPSTLSATAAAFVPRARSVSSSMLDSARSRSAPELTAHKTPPPQKRGRTPIEEKYSPANRALARLAAVPEEVLDPPESSTTPECGTSPARADDREDDTNLNAIANGVPPSGEKKRASVIVINPSPAASPCETDGAHPPSEVPLKDATPVLSFPPPGSPPDPAFKVEQYVVFYSHDVQGRRTLGSFAKRAMTRIGLASSRPVVLRNKGTKFVVDNVLVLAQKQIDVTKYFWQSWEGRTPDVTTDTISLFAGSFTHASHVFVFDQLAKHVICHEVFTKMQSKLLHNGVLKDTVRLRVSQLLADHPLHAKYCTNYRVLDNTITFIYNQLLLRGLMDEARNPLGVKPSLVDFRNGAVSRTSLFTARHLKFSARTPPPSPSTGSTVPFRW